MNKKEQKKLFRELFLSSFVLEHSYNYERQQALGFCVGIWPAIKNFYSRDEDRAMALQRHMDIFNTNPHLVSFITGATVAIEEKASTSKDFDYSIINNIKVGLMGPLAGIGDSFFWGTLRIIATGIGLSMAQQGNLLAPIVFLLMFNIPHLIIRYLGLVYGYKFGTSIISNVNDNGIIKKISKASNIVGLFVIGAMTASMVNLQSILSFKFGDQVFKVQEYLDQIFPGILSFGYTFLMYYFLKKNKSATFLLIFTLIFSLIAKYTGLF